VCAAKSLSAHSRVGRVLKSLDLHRMNKRQCDTVEALANLLGIAFGSIQIAEGFLVFLGKDQNSFIEFWEAVRYLGPWNEVEDFVG
jgi:hypothetical protein